MSFEVDAPLHTIAHISDTHLLGGDRKLFSSIDVAANITTIMSRLAHSEHNIEALVFTGDLADLGEPEAYRFLRATVEPLAREMGAQVVWTMGNHDEREPYARELFDEESAGEPHDRVYWVNGLRIISLDSTVPGYHHGDIEESQFEWLAAELASPAEHGTILALHHPPIPSHNEFVRIIELRNQERLASVLSGTDVRTILGGHLHYSTYSTFAGIPVAVASATCYTVDFGAPRDLLLSGVDGSQSIQLVHVYPQQVVHTIVPIQESRSVIAYPATQREMLTQYSTEEIFEMVSNKRSAHNREEQAISGGGEAVTPGSLG
ncbi:3',5'-cyclic AMP phosphodiesterase CpdA [Microbacteriaceae bacterium MWH-Ta3]|nr:3',5'-cyclic AMP phosphodiesterase CpdA [Microbacteriaceae bacterium MWH-Ta3]